MAIKNRTTSHTLEFYKDIGEKPYRYGYYNVLRRIECLNLDKPRIGQSIRPADEPVRLAQEPALTFENATLSGFKQGEGDKPPRVTQRFLGMFGANGPLPQHLTEHARERLRNSSDPTLSRFLDIFHHRMLALFYRAWANAEPTLSYDRPKDDWYSTFVGSLIGIGMPSHHNRDDMPDLSKLYYAGLLSNQTHNADGLRLMLQGFFNIPSHIEQFVGHWLELRPQDCWQLGVAKQTGTLGMNSILGQKVWDCQSKFRIVFGVMSYADYIRLLPGGDTLTRLLAVVRNYIGDELDWDIKLILSKEEIPEFKLGHTGQLGWTTWLHKHPGTEHAEDLILNPLKQHVSFQNKNINKNNNKQTPSISGSSIESSSVEA